jgi:hypothetical protein
MSQRIAALPRQRERERQRHVTTATPSREIAARSLATLLVGGTLVGGTLVASRHDRDIARFRAPRTATPLVSAPLFSL